MYECLRFDYARDALGYLINRYKIKEIYLPYYLCDVIRHRVYSEGVKINYYHIDDTFLPDKTLPEDAFILYPNYFGICDNNVSKLDKQYRYLIVDNAHSYYSEPKGFACFNSERKFRNVDKGADLMIRSDSGKPYSKNELLENEQKHRKLLFMQKHNLYKELNLLNIDENNAASPFCYPLLCKDSKIADETASGLEKEGMIIYRYWNNLPKNFNEYKFYRRLVPIPL